jgi:type I restriction enzyme S subunit
MRKGWEIKNLGEISDIVNGGTPDTNIPKFWDGENLWITPKDLGKLQSIFVDDTLRKITNEGLKNSSAKILPPNSIILSSRAPIGHLAINVKPISTNQGCKGLVPKKEINFLYLYYFLYNSVDLLNSLGTGATFKELSGSKLSSVEIPLPPLSEQYEIVSILDDAFESIELAKSNAEKNLINARELFESISLKTFSDGIKIKNWPLEKLEKYCKVVVGYVGPISKEYVNDEKGILLLSTKNIGDNGISLKKLTRINKSFHEKNKKSQLESGDIIVARHGESGHSAVIPEEIKEAHALNVIIIKKSSELSSNYISFLLNSGILNKISESKSGSVQEIINTSIIKDLIIPIPNTAEQIKIVLNLKSISEETKRLESIYYQKINDLEELKKSILQKAFNGELKTSKLSV